MSEQTEAPWPLIVVAEKTGAESLHRAGQSLAVPLIEFWRWSASDLMSNATRGVLAEWIVARALNIERGTRIEWDAFDLRTPAGISIEVKSCAYLQSWAQQKLSAIRFDIRPTQLDYQRDTPARRAQIYVFCLLHHKKQATVDPLDLEQWSFYLLPTAVLNAQMPTQKSLSLGKLLTLKPHRVNFAEMEAGVAQLAPNAQLASNARLASNSEATLTHP